MSGHEWPMEKRARSERAAAIRSPQTIPFAARDKLLRTPAFGSLVDAILEAAAGRSDPKETMARLSGQADTVSRAEELETAVPDNLLVLACVEAFRRIPTAPAWTYLWSLAWHSALLEQLLPEAVVAVAREDPTFELQVKTVASEVVRDARSDPGRRALPRDREHLRQLIADWPQIGTLSEIWRGLRAPPQLLFRGDDDGVLRIMADLDPELFVRLVATFENPYAVATALHASRALWSFQRWEVLLALAPPAFDETRRWTGSVIAPLLLGIARDQLQQGYLRLNRQIADNQPDPTAEIRELCTEIAKGVAGRADASACAERWAISLINQALMTVSNENLPWPGEPRSRAFIDATLIDALGRELPSTAWNSEPPPDAESWEPWCHRALLVWMASDGRTSMPPANTYLDQWQILPEDWAADRGRDLRQRARPFEVFGKRPDAYGIRLLAIPLADAGEPTHTWTTLWSGTQAIREIIEFGEFDAMNDTSGGGQFDAPNLMQLVFGLGLMMLERVIDLRVDLPYERLPALEGLLRLLFDAVREMTSIDKLNRTFWSEALRHLAVRRAIWSSDIPRELTANTLLFARASKPSLGDFFRALSGDIENVLALLDAALRNGVAKEQLNQALADAGIDLPASIAFAERMIALDNRRAAISESQLTAARSLLSP